MDFGNLWEKNHNWKKY